ncbi:hypothetical protein RJ641_016834 [Dillenia turbinata]|uniref:DUF7642 domain-containing protein n=1 Tax=Dillenia turbinata TaxID=194707 RepID=A0AAN8UX18_9MAGN
MLMGHTDGLQELHTSRELLFSDPVSEQDDDEETETSGLVLYTASFDELAENNVHYDTIIWVLISALLVLAWGVGIFMLLYLPFKRYILKKASRKLYVTPDEIVYKVSRPSFIPFWGVTTIERHVPLNLVIDIIIEQGCLQSIYGIHTIRVESIAHGKAAPVDELQIQGVSNPALLRKVIISEASKSIQDVGRILKLSGHINEGEIVSRSTSLTEGPSVLRSPSKGWMVTGSPHHASLERRGLVPGDLLLHKLEEVNISVKVRNFLY